MGQKFQLNVPFEGMKDSCLRGTSVSAHGSGKRTCLQLSSFLLFVLDVHVSKMGQLFRMSWSIAPEDNIINRVSHDNAIS